MTAGVLGSKACQEVAELVCGSQELETTHLPSLGLPAPACPPCFEQKSFAELRLFILMMMIFVERPPLPWLLPYLTGNQKSQGALSDFLKISPLKASSLGIKAPSK